MPGRRLGAAALGVCGIASLLLAAAAPANGAPPTCAGKPATIIGTEGGYDSLRGTAGPDVIVGLGGSDLIDGLSGDDTLCGHAGSDSLHGGGGRDELYGGEADESALDQLYDDDVSGAADADVLVGNGNVQLNYHSRTAAVYVDLLDPGPDASWARATSSAALVGSTPVRATTSSRAPTAATRCGPGPAPTLSSGAAGPTTSTSRVGATA